LLNYGDQSSKIVSVREASLLCNETRNFAKSNLACIKFLILLIGHVLNAGLKSRLGRWCAPSIAPVLRFTLFGKWIESAKITRSSFGGWRKVGRKYLGLD
jgi:hypothetical protein